MTKEILNLPDGQWYVDWTAVRRITRSYATQRSILRNGKQTTTEERDWYNPFSWAMPDVVAYEVDWDGQRRDRDTLTLVMMAGMRAMPEQRGGAGFRSFLRDVVTETGSRKAEIRTKLRQSSEITKQNIARSAGNYETLIDAAKFTRDASATTVLIGATVLSGGAAVGVAGAGTAATGSLGAGIAFSGAGATLKGVAKYQDNTHLDSEKRLAGAVMETTSVFLLNSIKVGQAHAALKGVANTGTAKFAEDLTIGFIEVGLDASQSLIEGKSLAEASNTAIAKQVVSTASGKLIEKVFATDPMKRLISRLPIPATPKLRYNGGIVSGGELAARTAKSMTESGAGNLAAGTVSNLMTPREQAAKLPAQGGMCEAPEQVSAEPDLVEMAIQPL